MFWNRIQDPTSWSHQMDSRPNTIPPSSSSLTGSWLMVWIPLEAKVESTFLQQHHLGVRVQGLRSPPSLGRSFQRMDRTPVLSRFHSGFGNEYPLEFPCTILQHLRTESSFLEFQRSIFHSNVFKLRCGQSRRCHLLQNGSNLQLVDGDSFAWRVPRTRSWAKLRIESCFFRKGCFGFSKVGFLPSQHEGSWKRWKNLLENT